MAFPPFPTTAQFNRARKGKAVFERRIAESNCKIADWVANQQSLITRSKAKELEKLQAALEWQKDQFTKYSDVYTRYREAISAVVEQARENGAIFEEPLILPTDFEMIRQFWIGSELAARQGFNPNAANERNHATSRRG